MPRKTRRSKRTTNLNHSMSGDSLRTSYGTVRVPKGSILYHATTSNTCILPDKPMLFTTLHPSDWYAEDIFISVIEPLSTTLSIILENADITYFEGTVKDIKWV